MIRFFKEYKTIIGDFHLTPREIIETYVDTTSYGDKNKLPHISVISFILPATEKTRLSNRQVDAVCSLRWNLPVSTGRNLSPAFPAIWYL